MIPVKHGIVRSSSLSYERCSFFESFSLSTAAAVENLEVMRFGDLQNERFRDEATFGTVQAVLQNSYGLE